jgi:hypothetical protein
MDSLLIITAVLLIGVPVGLVLLGALVKKFVNRTRKP